MAIVPLFTGGLPSAPTYVSAGFETRQYFDGKNDAEIAKLMTCDPSTVRRNKSRVISRLAVFLYGVTAVN